MGTNGRSSLVGVPRLRGPLRPGSGREPACPGQPRRTGEPDRTSSVLSRLRGDVSSRPVVDPGLAGGLREWLEDGLGDAVSSLDADAPPVRIGKDALNQVLLCEAHRLARAGAAREVTFELALGVLADAVFRQWITAGDIGTPFDDAMGAVGATGDGKVVDYVQSMPESNRMRLVEELDEHAERIVASWPVPSPSWFPRTQEHIAVPLAGGAIVLGGIVDLALGAPSSGRASVCLVELKSGPRRLEHRSDLHYYALLETLRSGARPFRVATYYSATGELDAEQVGDDVLVGALQRVLSAARRLCRLACGFEPARTPNPLCAWCSELPCCGPGQKRAGTSIPKSQGNVWADDVLHTVEGNSSDLEEISYDVEGREGR
jgi:hypothetical protein